ncbi:hypothetical protein KAU33_11735 [Candidatus Dependentiae bacterium]|nr:hypothetical protein [Candidatus Dependentiae bacterium]
MKFLKNKKLMLFILFLVIFLTPMPFYMSYIDNYFTYVIEEEFVPALINPFSHFIIIPVISIMLIDKSTHLIQPWIDQNANTEEFLTELRKPWRYIVESLELQIAFLKLESFIGLIYFIIVFIKPKRKKLPNEKIK